MPEHHFKLEEIVLSLSNISEIIHRRFQCMECNACEPCGPVFMKALAQLAEAGGKRVQAQAGERGRAG
ncbi:hypothetical protein FHW69_003132 [Luteibacter sp. Sphag1AF]|uniref:hypothetical protein n=1 Tax=Luteibacter sp. Sphag1AF TaxID=2587031 RepID=UPI0016158937|nr:hypothetical protein [Luteibacter sp. Sphag1AF]MBB3228497.1 hypothetical protein [Luteibacter sp. Sphag1AF]